jgi:hypothetical protein
MVIAVTVFDLYTDILFKDLSVQLLKTQPFFFWSSLATTLAHLSVCVVTVAYYARRYHSDVNLAVIRANATLYASILIYSVTNLDALVCFPWKSRQYEGYPWKSRQYEGYPRRRFLKLTYANMVFQSIPQLCIDPGCLRGDHQADHHGERLFHRLFTHIFAREGRDAAFAHRHDDAPQRGL